MEQKYFSPAEIAELLGYSKIAIYRKCKKGELPYYEIDGRIKLDIDDVNRYLKAHYHKGKGLIEDK